MESSNLRFHRQAIAIMGALLLLTAISIPLWAGSQEDKGEAQAEATDVDPTGEISLIKVDPKYVCMPNNKLFKKEQLSTEIDGETYYGCCKMCINALNSDPQQRLAIDPISGKEVDKAKAVIGAAPDNSIYYFESEENLENFRLAATDAE